MFCSRDITAGSSTGSGGHEIRVPEAEALEFPTQFKGGKSWDGALSPGGACHTPGPTMRLWVRPVIAGHGDVESQKKYGDVDCDPDDEAGGAPGAEWGRRHCF